MAATTLPPDIQQILTRLGANDPTLITLDLSLPTFSRSKNSLGENGGVAIGEALKFNSTLTTLDLSGNSLGEKGGVAIGEALSLTGLFGLSCRGSLKSGAAQLPSDNLIRSDSR